MQECKTAEVHRIIEELLTAMPIHPVTVAIALRTGQIDGENHARGIRIPLADLLIGVTGLELGYSVGTANLRHSSDNRTRIEVANMKFHGKLGENQRKAG